MSATAGNHQALLQLYVQQAQQAIQQAALQTYTSTGSALGNIFNVATTSATTTVATAGTGLVGCPTGVAYAQPDNYPGRKLNEDINVHDGEGLVIRLPDGTNVVVNKDGSFAINDKDSKVTYRANRVRDFNAFVNASDKLEAFIRFCGALGVKQDEMLNIPVKLFIGWLIIEAARADGENADVNLLEGIHGHVRPRCVRCKRFIARAKAARKIAFCRPICLEMELAA